MREILFRGKSDDFGELVEGSLLYDPDLEQYLIWGFDHYNGVTGLQRDEFCYHVIPSTVGQYTGLLDKHGKKIFTEDIVQYRTYDDFTCTSVVKLGEYKQDGSSGEYNGIDCIGYYVAVIEFICPDWCDEDFCFFHEHLKAQNILEVAKECEVIGNIYDNPELLEQKG